ncbi:MAG TPA: hypothetical protein VFT60_07370 [Bryobacteraceae bacterium]|nr:hypothetical protein [Bryobacteraceae bacterium]
MRILGVTVLLAILSGCGGGAPPPSAPPPDETKEPWYAETVARVVDATKRATDAFEHAKPDDASSLILQAEPQAKQLLSVLHPTLEANIAAADLDALYARMLFSNNHFEWAQFLYQKNVARWKYWKPQTPDTERRLKEAEAQVEKCVHAAATRKGPKLPKE